ncbi:DUF3078 domain-containing protein [Aquimarina sp. U1-2]|uniref:DUF3078 domain-containing protein n=1 Tax=Aquimarina sp. U1-2 TaxID=2823141 RepID=UPI001AEC7C0A|nr:DUF3078 domain-containing protein [Aquimarina sp. U1-2]MBP2831131.1 DUF3078 domain-containing protein [Aquimarina sp. U1-2]
MKRFLIVIFVVLFVSKIFSQEKKKTKQLDSIQLNLKRSIDSLLKNTPRELNVIVLKNILKEISPKKPKKPEHVGWKTKGKFSLLFNQSAFNFDWQGGGTTNVAGNGVANYEFNYKKNNLTWYNKILADYGLSFLKDEPFARKTNDRIEINSRLGKRIGNGNWNYSFFVNFLSQFDKGFRFETDPVTEETIRIEETHFFSPAFLKGGPGILWKKSDDLNINLAPVTSRIIFVDKEFTNVPGYEDGDYFGVDAGESTRFEFGGSLVANLKFELSERFYVDNILSLYSNYIEDPGNIDIDYTFNLNLKVNRYVSFSFVFQSIYDDNATSAFQIRQVTGIGLDYAF